MDLAALPVPEGASARVWLPAPADTPDQRVRAFEVRAPIPHTEARDALGNPIVYLEWTGRPPTQPVLLRLEVERSPAHGVPAARAVPGTPLDPARYTGASRKVPLGGMVRALGEQETRGHETDAEKIRALYDYVVRNMKYSKQGEGWGRGDAIWACTSKYGNCTDFHSVFIGMARSQGIPARFVIGFPIPPDRAGGEIPGYHCWSEAFEKSVGWKPVDASEAWKTGAPDAFFGALPSDRIQFTVGRDLTLEPPQAGTPLNYFIYPYAEVDGTPVEGPPARFRFRRLGEGEAMGEIRLTDLVPAGG